MLHRFRHFFISQALLTGATEGEVCEWVGHTDSKLIEHYRTLHADYVKRRMKRSICFGESVAQIKPSEAPDGGSREVA